MSQVNIMLAKIEQLVSCDLHRSAEALCCVYLSNQGARHRSIDASQHVLILEKSKQDFFQVLGI